MSEIHFTEIRVLRFPSGELVELQVTDDFLSRVRQRFQLTDTDVVPDTLIKSYLNERARIELERMDKEDDNTR